MYRVAHVLDDCEHYNDRDDREEYLEAGAEATARLHNRLCHGVDSARGPCAWYFHIEDRTLATIDSTTADATEVLTRG